MCVCVGGVTTGHSKLDVIMFQMRTFSPARPQKKETEILKNCHRLTQWLFVCKQSEKKSSRVVINFSAGTPVHVPDDLMASVELETIFWAL